jgi:hypothetical protein
MRRDLLLKTGTQQCALPHSHQCARGAPAGHTLAGIPALAVHKEGYNG